MPQGILTSSKTGNPLIILSTGRNKNNIAELYNSITPIMIIDPDGHMPKWLTWVLAGLAVAELTALTVVSFGLATPFGISVLIGIGMGAGIGAGSAVAQGKSFGDVVLSGISGGLIGGAMGFASVVGIMAGTALLAGASTIAATGIGAGITIGGAFGLATLTAGTAYALSYAIDTGANNREFSWGKFAGNFALGAIFGAGNFGIGSILGYSRMGFGQLSDVWDKIAYQSFKAIFKSAAFGSLSWVLRMMLR